MVVRQAKHGTTGSRLCDHGGEGGWQWVSACAAPVGRAHTVPTVEAIAAVGWCGLARPTHRSGGGEEGRWEAR
jgi:hypothetical protein